MRKNTYKPYIAMGITLFCVIAAAILFFFLLFRLPVIVQFFSVVARILRPIFIGIILAFLLLPVHRALLNFFTPTGDMRNKRTVAVAKVLAIVFCYVLAFAIMYLLIVLVVPQVYFSVVGLIEAFPDYIRSVQNWLFNFLEDNPDIQATVMPIYYSAAQSVEQWLNSDVLPNLESLTSMINWAKDSILPNITDVVQNVSAGIIALLILLKDVLVAIIVSVYLLVRKDIFAAQTKKLVYSIFPTRISDLIVAEARNAYRILNGFISGKLLDSLIIGIITLVACNLLRFPYPALLATIIGVTNIIPFFGPFIGAIPSALLIFLTNPFQCIYFVIFILILQQFDGNILGPRILGESTGLASFWVLFSIILFGGLFGVIGMVIGVPVFAIFYSLITRLVHRGLRRHGLPEETNFYIGKTERLLGAKFDQSAPGQD